MRFCVTQANGSPRSASGQRKLRGPRPIAAGGGYGPDKRTVGMQGVPKTMYRSSPTHGEGSSEEDVTF